MKKIASELGGVFNSSPCSQSSIGYTIVNGIKIWAKPVEAQGFGAPGISNELLFLDSLNKNPFNKIVFQSPVHQKVVTGVISFEDVSKCRSKTEKWKADVKINTTAKPHYVSIKQKNAEIWESADTYGAEVAKKYIDYLKQNGSIELMEEDGFYKVVPNIAIECSDGEAQVAVFGHDLIKNHGFVVIKNFAEEDFYHNGDTLYVECDQIIEELSHLEDHQKPYFIIRNDRSRTTNKIRGIRVLICYKSRVKKTMVNISLDQRFDL